MATITTKTAKNGSLICKLNGKREKRENVETAIHHANMYGGNIEIKNEFGGVYTSNFNGETYRFVDQYGKEVTFVFADNVIYNLARATVEFTANANVEESAVAEAETYTPQSTWEDPHNYTTAGNLTGTSRSYNFDADNYANVILAATVEEYAVTTAAFDGAILCEMHTAKVASGTYNITINGEYVSFKNHSIVRIDATRERQMYLEKDCKGRNRFYVFNPGHGQNKDGADDSSTRISARAVAERYMAKEAAKEQGKFFAAFFAPYRTSGVHEFTVMVCLTYVDGRKHIFSGEFNQYRQAQQFTSDVKAFAGDTPCQFFTKTRDHSHDVKPVWEDPHNYETVGCLTHARNLYPPTDTAPVAEPVKYIATQITFPTGHEGEPTREVSKTFDNLDDAARFIADDNPFIETETGYHTFAYDDGYFGGVYWAGYRIETTDGKILVEADDLYEVKGDEFIDNLVVKYINDNTAPAPPANNPLACLDNLGYEDDVIEGESLPEDDGKMPDKFLAYTIEQHRVLAKCFCDKLNAKAPAGWHVTFEVKLTVNADRTDYTCETPHNVTFNDNVVGHVDYITHDDIVNAETFFAQFAPEPPADELIDTPEVKAPADEFTAKLADFDAEITPAQVATLVYYTVTGSREDKTNWSKYKTFATTVAAAEWILSFAADNPDYAVYAAEITDRRNGLTRYTLTAADITALYPPEPAPDTVAAIARICATVNGAAPAGWEVYYDTPSKLFAVVHNDETVAQLTSVELYDAWDAHPPEDFFNAYDTHDVVEFDADGNISAIWF